MTLMPAGALELPALAELFNEGFSDYVWPMRLSDDAFLQHLEVNDIDLGCSRVAVDDRPAALTLVARRGPAGWVGGTATVPASRRRGLAEATLVAALEAVGAEGCREVWLEVIERNDPAIRLYEKLGFEVVRDLVVWSLPAAQNGTPPARSVDSDEAHAWIVEHRRDREPWQRADATLANVCATAIPLRGLVVERGGDIAAALVYHEDEEKVTALQAAAIDDAAAADALRAAGKALGVRVANVPEDGAVARGLEAAQARPLTRQHEMLLRL